MERMYQDFKDIAEFRLVYIREAHATDSRRPVAYAKEKGISQHKDYDQRCVTAQMLMDDESLTMPMLIDSMNNSTNEDYSAYPDRVFLVRTDGRLAVASDRGPWGFNPGIKAVEKWLEDFADSGKEPELTEEQIAKADAVTGERKKRAAVQLAKQLKSIVGQWNVENTSGEQKMNGTIEFSIADGKAIGVASAGDQTAELSDLRFNGTQLSFSLTIHETKMTFLGNFENDSISGKLSTSQQNFDSQWTKK